MGRMQPGHGARCSLTVLEGRRHSVAAPETPVTGAVMYIRRDVQRRGRGPLAAGMPISLQMEACRPFCSRALPGSAQRTV
jgi:hypothetical protein